MSYSHLSMISSFLILLLLDRTQANPGRITRRERDLSDSFDVNIGAGYGVDVSQPSASLPSSKATVTRSTNQLHRMLSDETVRRPRLMMEPEKTDIVTSRPHDADAWRDLLRKPAKVINMKEIQNVLHDLDDSSEYSKVVQVVKVPAIYEIHLEKTQQKTNRRKPPAHQVLMPHRKAAPVGRRTAMYNNQGPLGHNRPRLEPHVHFRGQNRGVRPFYSTLLGPSPIFDVKPAPASAHGAQASANLSLREDYVYGRPIERVSSPDEMNITVQPGATMVTFPREERFVQRSFSGSNGRCEKSGELHRRVDDVFITTGRPVYPPRIARRLFFGGGRDNAVKYYIVIRKKFEDEDDKK